VSNLNGNLDAICTQCHDNEHEDRDFSDVHERHVREEGKDCAACHNFSRPERGLALSRGEQDDGHNDDHGHDDEEDDEDDEEHDEDDDD
jgi:hypothetical protein